MKIAMIGHKAIPSTRGGIETVLTNICPLIAARGNEVVCYNRTADRPEKEYERDIVNGEYKGVKLKKARTLKIKGISAMLASFSAALACSFTKCEIVHFHAEGPSAAMFIPKLFGKKCVATVHGLDWQREKWGSGFASKYIKHGERTLVKHADAVIVLSQSAQQYFKQTYGRKTVIIPNGISRPKLLSDDIIKEKYGLFKESYICMVARLTKEKGAHYLIEAYKRLDTDKKLVICGDTSDTDEYVAELKKLAGDNKNIIFTGFISGDTLGQIYSNSYAVCLPSDLEGMSISLLEALSYSNAVLCSDIPENTSVCGDAALTFKKGNVDDLTQKLDFLLKNPQEAKMLREISAEYVLSRFSWEQTAKKTAELYEEILKDKKGGNDRCRIKTECGRR